jgi:hypothetical protein
MGMKCPEETGVLSQGLHRAGCAFRWGLPFGSDHNKKTSLEEGYKTDQDGMQRDEK